MTLFMIALVLASLAVLAWFVLIKHPAEAIRRRKHHDFVDPSGRDDPFADHDHRGGR